MKIMLMLMTAIIFCSCATVKNSRFSASDIQPGMSKQAIIARCGKPFKKSFSQVGDILYEDFYYKETIYKDYWFEVNTILHFENGKLVSLEPGHERRLYQPPVVLEKK
ncbi:DUF2845 domain-containing protein [Chitinophaga varians]|uniref:DUF2845 domain-containing protein n=1 Tax=Chitinophaga varians TaxID=2202339 RepID=UPI00165F90F6|nr:DUF2845 domain-containing protein [Chitinophaga varians]MBC9912595.1 DUF2845 domain-containing protein [Chitinophaga varians]